MNLMLLLTPLTVSVGILAIVFAAILYGLDRRRTSHQKHLFGLMRTFVAKNALQQFSVIVRVDEATESIIPLLDSLEDQAYQSLQVLILVDSAVSKKTVAALRRLRRQKRGLINLRIARKNPGKDEIALIRRYSTGEALVWLKPSDSITKDFFTKMSFELLDESRNAIAPKFALRMDDSLLTANRALHVIAQHTVNTLSNRTSHNHLVVRRSAYLSSSVLQPVSAEHSAITVSALPGMSRNVGIEASILTSILLVAIVSAALLPFNWQIIPIVLLGIVILLMTLRLVAYPYSAWTKLSLIFLIPLWPVVAVIFSGLHSASSAVGWAWNRRSRATRQA